MIKIDVEMDGRLMAVEYLSVYATDCGETLEDTRAQAKQEIDRIVNKGVVLFLGSRREAVRQKGTKKQAHQVKINAGDRSRLLRQVHNCNLPATHFL